MAGAGTARQPGSGLADPGPAPDRVRASRTLVFSQSGGELLACNFLTREVFACAPDVVDLISRLDDWTGRRDLADLCPGLTEPELDDAIDGLVAMTALVSEGSELAEREASFERAWHWGLPAAMLHFCLQDSDIIPLAEAEAMQRQKVEAEGRLALYQTNEGLSEIRSLPDPFADNPLIRLMAERRSIRAAADRPVTLRQLSDCLFAGLGIVGETENCVGRLPLKMTPSGGARNPFEAYVLARNVEGLAPGIHHYSALDHTLGKVGELGDLSFSALIGGQEWGDDMGCLIILVARLERTMWKYADANAYRVVLIEAGHVGQNVMLAATGHGLSACPTAALNHSLIGNALGLTEITHAPIYALSLSVPDRARARPSVLYRQPAVAAAS